MYFCLKRNERWYSYMNNNMRKQFHDAYIVYDIEKIKGILKQDLPIRLIKFFNGSYCDNDNIYLNAIAKDELWLSSPKEFNDPFDCIINMDYELEITDIFINYCNQIFGEEHTKEVLNCSKELIHKTAEEVRSQLIEQDEKIKNNVFVSCFSEFSNMKSLLMWGHYANNHKGFCAEYDYGDMIMKFPEGVIPILYDDNYYLNDNCKNEKEYREYRLRVAFTKAREWEKENEWRILDVNEKREGETGYYKEFISPIKIYMGCKIDKRLENDLKALCRRKGIELYKMLIKPNSFHLDYIQVSSSI